MQWSNRRNQKQEVTRWFAWYPVNVADERYTTVWLGFVWKEKYWYGELEEAYHTSYYLNKPPIVSGD